MSTFRSRPLPLRRYCIGLLALIALSAGSLLTGVSAQPSDSDEAISLLNQARIRAEVQPLAGHDGLDQLAARYLDEILLARNLVPPGYGRLNARVLSEDVVAAIGERGVEYRYTGVVVSYGNSLNTAVQIATGTEANGPALFEPALDFAGVASASVPAPSSAEEPWYAPPPGGIGRDIEMTGLTIVVIVTAGDWREGI